MSSSRGIFGLDEFYNEQTSNKWSTGVWIDASESKYKSLADHYGYFNGSSPSNPSKLINKIDYDNDTVTASPRGLLSPGSYQNTSVGNLSYGYVFGNPSNPPSGWTTEVERIDYSNDSVNALIRGGLQTEGAQAAATGNLNYGYFGGFYAPTTNSSNIDRIDYSNDLANGVTKSILSSIRFACAATGTQNYGYWAGGRAATNTSTRYSAIDRLDYSNDTANAGQKCSLDTPAISDQAATGNANYGYFAGGMTPGSPDVAIDTIERLDYSNDTANASPKSALSAIRYALAATGNANYGWFGGGKEPAAVSTVNRLDYASDTANTLTKGPLSANSYYNSACSSTANALPKQYDSVPQITEFYNIQPIGTDYGYFGGGYDGTSYLPTIDRLDYSNDTSPAPAKGPLSTGRNRLAATSNQNYGYFGGGYDGTNVFTSVDRLDYFNDTATALVRGPLNQKRRNLGALGNENFGWFAGGEDESSSVDYSIVERIDYSNDTATAVNIGDKLIHKLYSFSTVGNQNYGYIGGGKNSVGDGGNPNNYDFSTIFRLDYSNDTATVVNRGSILSERVTESTATGNANFGYFGTGNTSGSSMLDRLDYSNDTVDPVDKANNVIEGVNCAATGNQNYGYFAGGRETATGTYIDSIKCLDYSNDSSIVVKGNLSNGRISLAGVSSRANALPTTKIVTRESLQGILIPVGNDYGYFGGGGSPYKSDLDRIDFSNDGLMILSRANILTQRLYGTGTSNESYGYFAGGYQGKSSIDRLDYSNDTVMGVIKGNLITSRWHNTALSLNDVGYFLGGSDSPSPIHPAPPSSYSSIDRIVYASDTVSTIPATLPVHSTYNSAATGNQVYGYVAGGAPATSKVSRLNYSNETMSLSPSTMPAPAPLGGTGARSLMGATGNDTSGYFAGGWNNSADAVRIINKINYASDTWTYVGQMVDSGSGGDKGTAAFAATGNQSAAYFAGGYDSPGPITVSSIQRMDYSNSDARIVNNFSSPKNSMIGVSSKQSGLRAKKILLEPFTFGEVTARIVNPYGYFAGGESPGSVGYSIVQRIDYSNDSANSLNRGHLTLDKYSLAAAGNENYGYFGGGIETGPPVIYYSTVDRIDYSSDNILSVVRGSLPIAVGENAAVGNSNYGYWLGGYDNSVNRSELNRLDYANDSFNMVQMSNIEDDCWGKGMSMGTNNYGYFAGGIYGPGGSTNSSRIYRLDYANDTNALLLSSSLVINKLHSEGTGNKDYGYIMGGWTDGIGKVSSTDRFNYSNDTAGTIFRGPLTAVKYWHGATGSQNFGYIAGGKDDSDVRSSIERLNYSNDTAIASTKGSLYTTQLYLDNSGISAQENQFTSLNKLPTNTFSASTYGYFAGGETPGTPVQLISTVDRLDFTNDTANAVTKGPLSTSKSDANHSGLSSKTHGYVAGGRTPAAIVTDKIDRIDYANDTSVANASIGGQMIEATHDSRALFNSNYGYVCGGDMNPGNSTTVSRLDFSNDGASLVDKSPLTTGTADIRQFSAVGNKDYGYFAGGLVLSGGPTSKKTVVRVDYNNDTTAASPKGDLITEVRHGVATGNNYFGYLAGGIKNAFPGSNTSLIQRIDYSNDTTEAQVTSNLTYQSAGDWNSLTATGNQNYGYWAGGGDFVSKINRLDYSNDTLTTISKGKLSTGVNNTSGFSARENGIHGDQFITLNAIGNNTQNSPASYGYFAGGELNSPPVTSNVDRIDYSNDTATATTVDLLVTNRALLSSISNQSYGYFAGGDPSPYSPYIERLDYSNNSISTINATLTSVRSGGAAVGNNDYGYFAGGTDGSGKITQIDRIDYSNDIVRSPSQGLLTLGRDVIAATGNKDYGYFGSGVIPGPAQVSTVDRIDYSNDSAKTLEKGSLSQSRSRASATGNKDYGYFGGGYVPGGPVASVSTIDRIDYSNDLATATPKGTISDNRYGTAATGNKDYGYWGGGYDTEPSPDEYRSTIDRIDYSNDTAGAPARCLLTNEVRYSSGASAGANGLPQ